MLRYRWPLIIVKAPHLCRITRAFAWLSCFKCNAPSMSTWTMLDAQVCMTSIVKRAASCALSSMLVASLPLVNLQKWLARTWSLPLCSITLKLNSKRVTINLQFLSVAWVLLTRYSTIIQRCICMRWWRYERNSSRSIIPYYYHEKQMHNHSLWRIPPSMKPHYA